MAVTFAEAGIKPTISQYKLAVGGSWDRPAITIDKASPEDDQWVIRWMGYRLNDKGEWEFEPMNSARTESFKRRTRWPLVEALERAITLPADLTGIKVKT